MKLKTIYIVQFGSGTTINLLPLAAGMLHSRLKHETKLMLKVRLAEIVFQRPNQISDFVEQLEEVLVIGFSCFQWNTNVSLQAAQAVRQRFPTALIILGGPCVPHDLETAEGFLASHPYVDLISTFEGEETFVSVCWRHLQGQRDFSVVPGLLYRDINGYLQQTELGYPNLTTLSSPYLDGTFDELYVKYANEFSGVILETNRGCPYKCTYCTWGNLPTHQMREKPIEVVRQEIDWVGRHGIKYVAMSDSNFGIHQRDVEVAELFAECRRKYNAPDFISVSWVKNSSSKVLRIADVLHNCGIGFRVTLSLQSLNPGTLQATRRLNVRRDVFEEIKSAYRRNRLFSYTELILGLPNETLESYLNGLEECLSDSVLDQLYVYPCLLFPNTELATRASRQAYGIQGRLIPNRYTKSKEYIANEERVEIVIGTNAMSMAEWREAFVISYCTLALHDDRLAFFILRFLKTQYNLRIVELIQHARTQVERETLPLISKAFTLLESTARGVQEEGHSHLIEPTHFGGIPYDPPNGIFLELLMDKQLFYEEFYKLTTTYLLSREIQFETEMLKDLFAFQNAVLAHPFGPPGDCHLQLKYNWPEYFAANFYMPSKPLKLEDHTYRIVDPRPSYGSPQKFLKHHYDIRGVPPFNDFYNEVGEPVFPPPNWQPQIGRPVTLACQLDVPLTPRSTDMSKLGGV